MTCIQEICSSNRDWFLDLRRFPQFLHANSFISKMLPSIIQMLQKGVHKFSKNLGATFKFNVPEG